MVVYYHSGCRRWRGRGSGRLVLHTRWYRTCLTRINDSFLLYFTRLKNPRIEIIQEKIQVVLPANFSVERLYAHFTVKSTKWLVTIIVPFTVCLGFFIMKIWCRHKANNKVTPQTFLYRLWRHKFLKCFRGIIKIRKNKSKLILLVIFYLSGAKPEWNILNKCLSDNHFTIPHIHPIAMSGNKTGANVFKMLHCNQFVC